MEIANGIIISLHAKKRFGWIRQANGTDLFFHALSCLEPFKNLREGMAVQFMVVESKERKDAKKKAIAVVVV
ncbi:cold shock domain-containing protein [Desulfotomaculum copahuensis]|uniref:Cold-shock domain-containing protein n=1 Tax=Desulfotomaculum copahuensis TaxID=1838280 RepID=A0A1B7LAG3_9FIRM|nr:cold shock domain-containing protein [Desulfotomaculum copahuensis]OAT79316.1 hypothetical protein A6M21_16270 [Desulfotomaculum copahuensis]